MWAAAGLAKRLATPVRAARGDPESSKSYPAADLQQELKAFGDAAAQELGAQFRAPPPAPPPPSPPRRLFRRKSIHKSTDSQSSEQSSHCDEILTYRTDLPFQAQVRLRLKILRESAQGTKRKLRGFAALAEEHRRHKKSRRLVGHACDFMQLNADCVASRGESVLHMPRVTQPLPVVVYGGVDGAPSCAVWTRPAPGSEADQAGGSRFTGRVVTHVNGMPLRGREDLEWLRRSGAEVSLHFGPAQSGTGSLWGAKMRAARYQRIEKDLYQRERAAQSAGVRLRTSRGSERDPLAMLDPGDTQAARALAWAAMVPLASRVRPLTWSFHCPAGAGRDKLLDGIVRIRDLLNSRASVQARVRRLLRRWVSRVRLGRRERAAPIVAMLLSRVACRRRFMKALHGFVGVACRAVQHSWRRYRLVQRARMALLHRQFVKAELQIIRHDRWGEFVRLAAASSRHVQWADPQCPKALRPGASTEEGDLFFVGSHGPRPDCVKDPLPSWVPPAEALPFPVRHHLIHQVYLRMRKDQVLKAIAHDRAMAAYKTEEARMQQAHQGPAGEAAPLLSVAPRAPPPGRLFYFFEPDFLRRLIRLAHSDPLMTWSRLLREIRSHSRGDGQRRATVESQPDLHMDGAAANAAVQLPDTEAPCPQPPAEAERGAPALLSLSVSATEDGAEPEPQRAGTHGLPRGAPQQLSPSPSAGATLQADEHGTPAAAPRSRPAVALPRPLVAAEVKPQQGWRQPSVGISPQACIGITPLQGAARSPPAPAAAPEQQRGSLIETRRRPTAVEQVAAERVASERIYYAELQNKPTAPGALAFELGLPSARAAREYLQGPGPGEAEIPVQTPVPMYPVRKLRQLMVRGPGAGEAGDAAGAPTDAASGEVQLPPLAAAAAAGGHPMPSAALASARRRAATAAHPGSGAPAVPRPCSPRRPLVPSRPSRGSASTPASGLARWRRLSRAECDAGCPGPTSAAPTPLSSRPPTPWQQPGARASTASAPGRSGSIVLQGILRDALEASRNRPVDEIGGVSQYRSPAAAIYS
eukprot:TRINITY_DN179_c1_g1_i5.p1 TRINITY_DN179_c1_g1~~TRINITY_DN179_c1_g1_i5.p1  ORF type:complete len:1040 (+),score=218.18 TRINITY_DN179_c1_g1_i5:70-3189(+)